MDRKTLLYKINRLYDCLDLKSRDLAFEFLKKESDDATLYRLYCYMDSKIIENMSIDFRTKV